MIWTDFRGECDIAAALCPVCGGCSVEKFEGWGREAVDAFIERAVELLPRSTHMEDLRVHPDDWHWEWHVGLAKEFLRQSAYEDLTPPRACLALIAAGEHVRIASELIDGLKFG
jgi:hypothetical protein